MTDLDFDELDRAVNSLIAKAPEHAPEEVKERVLTIDSTSVPNTQLPSVPSVPAVQQTPIVPESSMSTPGVTPMSGAVNYADAVSPAATSPAAVTPSATLATRRSTGRFMDVVHPSSDMRPREASPSPSRQGLTLNPLTSSTVPEAPSPTPPVTSPVVSPRTNDWPDPLDFTPTPRVNSPVESTVPTVEAPVPKPEPTSTPSVETTPDDTLNSPFLPDAKVDKRPLGAFSSETPVVSSPALLDEPPTPPQPPIEPSPEAPLAPDATGVEDDEVSHDDPQTAAPEAPLPEELQSDLLSIESATAEPSDSPTAKADTNPQADNTPIGPTAITQQYSETPSTGEQKNGAIFDTASYHKPLNHPVKKKSGWLWIVWILLLLIIGGGVGAAVYFFVLPQL